MKWLVTFLLAIVLFIGIMTYRSTHSPKVDVTPIPATPEDVYIPDIVPPDEGVDVPITPPPQAEPSVGEDASPNQPQPVYPANEETAPDEEIVPDEEDMPELGPLPRPPKPKRPDATPFRPPYMTPGQ